MIWREWNILTTYDWTTKNALKVLFKCHWKTEKRKETAATLHIRQRCHMCNTQVSIVGSTVGPLQAKHVLHKQLQACWVSSYVVWRIAVWSWYRQAENEKEQEYIGWWWHLKQFCPNEVAIYLNMFSSLVKDKIYCDGYSSFIVTLE